MEYLNCTHTKYSFFGRLLPRKNSKSHFDKVFFWFLLSVETKRLVKVHWNEETPSYLIQIKAIRRFFHPCQDIWELHCMEKI